MKKHEKPIGFRPFRWALGLVLIGALIAAACFAPQASASQATSSAAPASAATPKPTPTLNPVYAELILKEGDEGPLVENLQQRLADLGYYTYKVTGYFGAVTTIAIKDFQQDNKLSTDGVFGGQTATFLVANGATTNSINRRIPTPTPTPKPKKTAAPRKGEPVPWSKARSLVAWGGGSKFKAIDVRSGREYYLKRVGGTNHMDVEPASAVDTKTLKQCYGGVWSYDRRPTVVYLGGKWIAASINGFPHGKETVPNNDMRGQICLHFKNSRTHGTNSIDAAHQRCIAECSK